MLNKVKQETEPKYYLVYSIDDIDEIIYDVNLNWHQANEVYQQLLSSGGHHIAIIQK